MRSYYKNILLAAALLTAAAACTKEGPGSGTDPLSGVPISISATAPETKAMLDANTFKTVGNVIKIYDYVTSDGSTTEHIDAYVTPYDQSAGSDQIPNHPDWDPTVHWPFFTYATDGTTKEYQHYQWIPGNHKFFGWLAMDANMTSDNTPEFFFGDYVQFNETTHVLTLGPKVITAASPQFDFMYSDVHTRDMDNNPYYTAVPLKFSHLFSALSVGIDNQSTAAVTLNDLRVSLYNNMSAEIGFGNYLSFYPNTDVFNLPTEFRSVEYNANNIITAGTIVPNAFNFSSDYDYKDDPKEYKLVWPHTDDLVSGKYIDKDNTTLTPCKFYISYVMDYGNGTTTSYTDKEVLFPDGFELLAGNKYHINITIVDIGIVKISYLVTDWNNVIVNVPSFN